MRVIFQSTPPRRGRHNRRIRLRPGGAISIHAPAQGATSRPRSAPRCKCDFNPRPRAGGDLRGAVRLRAVARISIHAPAQGATKARESGAYDRDISIHAPAQGATRAGILIAWPIQFQSTPPRRGRRRNPHCGTSPAYFNPRPRAGGDTSPSPPFLELSQFQSTPPRRGRP